MDTRKNNSVYYDSNGLRITYDFIAYGDTIMPSQEFSFFSFRREKLSYTHIISAIAIFVIGCFMADKKVMGQEDTWIFGSIIYAIVTLVFRPKRGRIYSSSGQYIELKKEIFEGDVFKALQKLLKDYRRLKELKIESTQSSEEELSE